MSLFKRLGRIEMNEKIVLKALKQSISKWRKIVRSTKALDLGPENCALCKLFSAVLRDEGCSQCPVFWATGARGCVDSPYSLWLCHQSLEHRAEKSKAFHRHPYCKECLYTSRRELKFLEEVYREFSKGGYNAVRNHDFSEYRC